MQINMNVIGDKVLPFENLLVANKNFYIQIHEKNKNLDKYLITEVFIEKNVFVILLRIV